MSTPTPTLHSRIECSFLCLAVTDALGAPLEFGPRITDPSKHVRTMLPNPNFGLGPGHFTDDTSMALCLAFSLLESQGQTDPQSQARAYISWFRNGFMSSVPGRCFDIGVQTRQTLTAWEPTIRKIESGLTNTDDEVVAMQSFIDGRFAGDRQCGNGSLMRVLPCVLVARSEEHAVRLARESSSLTHPNPRCADACHLYAVLVYRALRGGSKDDLFAALSAYISGPQSAGVDSALRQAFEGYSSIDVFSRRDVALIKSSGYVVHTLEAALWAFFSTETYRDGAIRVVNLGDDADTVGAVYGGLAGAFYGHIDVIPKEWLDEMKAMNAVNVIVARILHNFHRDAE